MQKPKETVFIGLGAGGQNILNQMLGVLNNNTKFISINADEQILKLSKTDNILFPQEKRIFKKFYKNKLVNNLKYLCNSLFCKKPSYGCGGDTNIGENLAKKYASLLKNELEQSDRVFVISTLGGGFGSGATPIIVDYIKQFDLNLTVIVTIPFRFEGKRRRLHASECINKLKRLESNLIIFNNDEFISNEDKISVNDALDVVGFNISFKILEILKDEDRL